MAVIVVDAGKFVVAAEGEHDFVEYRWWIREAAQGLFIFLNGDVDERRAMKRGVG